MPDIELLMVNLNGLMISVSAASETGTMNWASEFFAYYSLKLDPKLKCRNKNWAKDILCGRGGALRSFGGG